MQKCWGHDQRGPQSPRLLKLAPHSIPHLEPYPDNTDIIHTFAPHARHSNQQCTLDM
jgi:hypothetical protein